MMDINERKEKRKLFRKIERAIEVIIICIIVALCIKDCLRKFVYKEMYMDEILQNNVDTGIDPYLILSIIKVESNFNEMAISLKGALGLMQVLPSTAGDISKETLIEHAKLLSANENIKIGINYLNLLIKYYDGNQYLAICAYNAGIGNVDRWIESGILSKKLSSSFVSTPYKETNNYLKKVIFNYKMYKWLY